jgi:uncharacterized HAD superfamily protein
VRIGLDIDGVMYKWEEHARYMLREVLPESPFYNDQRLMVESKWWTYIPDTVGKKHWNWLWKEGAALGLFRDGALYPGTSEAVHKLAKMGEVILITHRPKQAVRDTLAWLGKLDLPLSGLHILTEQSQKSKAEPICDIYLDDKPDNVDDLFNNTGGAVSCLMRRPWNSRFLPMTGSVDEMHDWDDFIRRVERAKCEKLS